LPLTRDETVIREVEKVDNSTDRIIEIRGVERSTSIRGSILKPRYSISEPVRIQPDVVIARADEGISRVEKLTSATSKSKLDFDDLSSGSSGSVSSYSSGSYSSGSSYSSYSESDTDFDELSGADERIEGQKEEVVVNEGADNTQEEEVIAGVNDNTQKEEVFEEYTDKQKEVAIRVYKRWSQRINR
jgi:hypothetical protein